MRVRVEFGYYQRFVAEVEVDSVDELRQQYADREGELFDELESDSTEVDGGYDDAIEITVLA